MRFTSLLTLIFCFIASFSFSQTKEISSSKVSSRVSNVKKVDTDKSKLKAISPVKSKKIVVTKEQNLATDPKKK